MMSPPRDSTTTTTTRSSKRPSSRRSGTQRTRSERETRRENRRKLLDTLDASEKQMTKDSSHSASKASRSSAKTQRVSNRTPRSSRQQRREGEARRRSTSSLRRASTTEEIPTQQRHSHAASFRRASTTEEIPTARRRPQRHRSLNKPLKEPSTKDLLESLPNEEQEPPRESMTFDDLSKSIQMASSMHITRRDVGKQRAGGRMSVSLHNSMNVLDHSSGRHSGSMSRSSRHSHGSSRLSGSQQRQRQRRRRERRSTQSTQQDESPMDDESIRVLQFDCHQGGLNIVDANNVHSKSSRNSYVDKMTVLLPEDLSVAVTEETASLENSFSSSVVQEEEEDLPLMLTGSEDSEEEEDAPKEHKHKSSTAKQAFKAVSKLLATPRARRKAVTPQELMDMSMASLQL